MNISSREIRNLQRALDRRMQIETAHSGLVRIEGIDRLGYCFLNSNAPHIGSDATVYQIAYNRTVDPCGPFTLIDVSGKMTSEMVEEVRKELGLS